MTASYRLARMAASHRLARMAIARKARSYTALLQEAFDALAQGER